MVAIHLLLHDRAGTLAIYYIKTKSRLSVGNFSCTHFSPWFQLGLTPDLLNMKCPSLQITKSVFKRNELGRPCMYKQYYRGTI